MIQYAPMVNVQVPMQVWEQDGFTLELRDNGPCEGAPLARHGHSYRLYDRGELIFAGDDFEILPYPLPERILALLDLLSVGPDGTEDKYFKFYTPTQIEWRDRRSEALRESAENLDEELHGEGQETY